MADAAPTLVPVSSAHRSGRHTLAFLAIVLLLGLFGTLSFTAAMQKSPTFDETLHVPAGWVHLSQHDFRANPEHPPLWKYYASLPHLLHPLKPSIKPDLWGEMCKDLAYQWSWSVYYIYRTPGNDADAIVNESRFMMMLVGVALGAAIAGIAWKLGGPAAGVVGAALYCLDPNFTAHASLVTNDVSFSLLMLLLIYTLWLTGQRATWPRLIALALICGVGVSVKYSALLFGPIVFLVLALRAAARGDWTVGGRVLTTRLQRFVAVLVVCFGVAVIGYVIIWSVYLFRYSAAADGGTIGWDLLIGKTRINELFAKHPGVVVTVAEQRTWQPSMLTRLILFCRDHKLLPEGFLFGVLHVHMGTLVRPSFLMGKTSQTGWWYYFPLAMLFKTPLATLAAWAGAAVVGTIGFKRWWNDPTARWLALCLGVPVVWYMGTSMRTNLNLGVRHVFPVYPVLFIATALAAARVWNRTIENGWADRAAIGASDGEPDSTVAPRVPVFLRAAVVLLVAVLAIESLPTYPNYLPFFNRAAGGWWGGLKLLGDSNLDWGQDLKTLAKWQVKNPQRKLYFCYFGSADPWYYGLRYTNMPGGYQLGPEVEGVSGPGVIAISATALQGIYIGPFQEQYVWMLHAKPIEVLGGSMYLFEYPYTGPTVEH